MTPDTFKACHWSRALSLLALALVAGCTFTFDESHIETGLSAPTPIALADGRSEIAIEVTGNSKEQVVVSIEGAGASLRSPIGASPVSKQTIFLEGGEASLSVVSTRAGTVTVRIEANEVRSEIAIEFQPIRLAAGEPGTVKAEAGVLVHEVCIAASTPFGVIRAPVGGSLSPASVRLSAELPPDANCPPTLPGNVECHADANCGYAIFEWRSASGAEAVTFDYLNLSALSDAAADFILSAPLAAAGFPGYAIGSAAPAVPGEGLVGLTLSLTFAALPALSSSPAGNTGVEISFPGSAQAPSAVAVSSGTLAAPQTNEAGELTLYFSEANNTGIHALFATPTGGELRFVTDLDFGPST